MYKVRINGKEIKISASASIEELRGWLADEFLLRLSSGPKVLFENPFLSFTINLGALGIPENLYLLEPEEYERSKELLIRVLKENVFIRTK